MKTLKLTFLLLTFMSVVAFAGPHHKHHMKDSLDLTEDQQQQMHEVMLAKKDKIKAAMDIIHEETQQELATFLTTEQLEKYKEMQHNRKLRRHKKMRKHKENKE